MYILFFVFIFLVSCTTQDYLTTCPQEWIDNQEPTIVDTITPEPAKEYYILDGKRVELEEYENGWVKNNCEIEKETVY